MTHEEVVGELSSGMTIGIGGWGSRRKPMSLVRAILCSDLTDLTVVTYGGPDAGLLCAAGKVRRLVYGFVSLDSIALDPHFRAIRQAGDLEVTEYDEGMLQWDLYAAGIRVPFLPTRAGLGSDIMRVNPELKTVADPYGSGEELVAVPALHLDAALVHMNRADAHGNAQFLGPDPYFDDLYCMAAERAYVSCEQMVPTAEMSAKAHPATMKISRMMVRGVVEAPNGGPLHLLRARLRPRREVPEGLRRRGRRSGDLDGVHRALPLRHRGRLPAGREPVPHRAGGMSMSEATRAEVCAIACAETCRDNGEVLVSAFGTIPTIGARLARHTFSPDLLLSDGEASLVRGTWAVGAPVPEEVEAWIPFRTIFDIVWNGKRHVMMIPSQIDAYGNMNLSAIGDHAKPKVQLLGARGAPGNSVCHPTSYWVPKHRTGCSPPQWT